MSWNRPLILAGILLGASAAAETPSLAGHWLVSADLNGTRLYMTLDLEQADGALSGNFNGTKLTGTISGSRFHIVAEDSDGADIVDGEIRQGKLFGSMQGNNSAQNPSYPDLKKKYEFMAEPVPPLTAGPGKQHDFKPTVFYREFSPSMPRSCT